MINNRPWIALYSHTGSEIVKISQKLGTTPDLVVTNNDRPLIHVEHSVRTSTKPSVMDYRTIFNTVDDKPIVTLHGWMRIVPGEICKEYDIYNLHPGLITDYPELKGKDPQKRVFDMLNSPQYVGCVLHRATAELDSGPQLMTRRVLNTYANSNILTSVLHEMAGSMWVDFFQQEIYNL